MATADSVLLERWQRRGDADAFAELVQRYSGMVHASCRRVLGDATLAEDVAQECFIELMRSRARIRVSLGAWLHTLATRRALDRIKGDARRRRREERIAADHPVSQEAGVEMAEVLACLDEAIEALPAKYREVVVARFLDGEPHTAVAQRLGIAESTVRYRVNEAVARLRDHLKRRGVVASLAGLTAALETTAEAAPPASTARICKMAVASGPPAAGFTLLPAGLLAKSAAALTIAAALVTGAWVHQQQGNGGEAAPPEGIPAPPALADASNGARESADGAPPVAASAPSDAATPSTVDAPAEPFSVRGRVYDADTGAGIAGARLQIYPTGGGAIVARSEPTGTDGVYRFSDLGDGAYSVSPERLAAYPDPRGSTRAAVVLKDGQPISDIDFALKKGVSVSGTVVDRSGKPVPGADVGAKSTRVVNPIYAESDTEGRFTIFMPDATNELMVQAQGAGFESLSQTGITLPAEGVTGLVLTLDQPRTASVSGVILDGNGAGVPGAQVHLNHKTERVFIYAGETTADERGAFQVAGCAAGDYGIIVTPKGANGYSGSEEYLALTLAEGEQRKDIEIVYGEKGGLAIAGRVVDSAGNPVPRATVTCYGTTMERAYTGDDGRFLITGLDGREPSYGLEAEHHDYSRTSASAAAGSLDLEIVLKSRGRIEGRVLRADTGAPLTNFQLAYIQGRVRGWGGFSAGSTDPVESEDGTLALPNLNAGDLSLAVYAPDFAPEWQCVQVNEGEPTEVVFRLQPAPAFTGTVVNGRGEPVAGAFVYYAESVSLEQMDRNAAARTDDTGHFTIESMPRDLPRLCAYADGYGAGVAEPPGDGRIVLPETATINGVIALGDLDPNETNINYYYPENPHLPSGYMRPNPDGTFQLTGLTPGDLSISVYPNAAPVHRGVQHDVRIEAGKTASLEFVFAPGNAVLEGVIRADGEAVPGAFLRLERRQGGLADYMRIRSGEDGSFRFEDAWAGDLVLEIMRVRPGEAQEVVTEEVEITLQDGQVLREDIEVARCPEGTDARLSVMGSELLPRSLSPERVHAPALGCSRPAYGHVLEACGGRGSGIPAEARPLRLAFLRPAASLRITTRTGFRHDRAQRPDVALLLVPAPERAGLPGPGHAACAHGVCHRPAGSAQSTGCGGRIAGKLSDPGPDEVPAPLERGGLAASHGVPGRFEFPDAPRDMPYLSAWHPDYAPARAAVTDNTTISLRKAGRLDVEVFSNGEPVPKAYVSSYCDGDQHLGYSVHSTTDASGRAILNEIIPGRVRVRVDVAGQRDQFVLVNMAAGERKSLRVDLAPAEARVEGYLYQNGTPLPDGIVRLVIETGPGAERLEARSGPDGYFLFPEAPAGRAQLVASPGSLVQSTFMDDIPLRAGEMTTLSVDMAAERKVTGAISGIHPGDRASVMVLRGAMAFNEARDTAEDVWYQPEVAALAGVGEDGLFESTLLDPGTYTLLVATRPEDDSGNRVYHESRVVQVRSDGDPHADFALRY